VFLTNLTCRTPAGSPPHRRSWTLVPILSTGRTGGIGRSNGTFVREAATNRDHGGVPEARVRFMFFQINRPGYPDNGRTADRLKPPGFSGRSGRLHHPACFKAHVVTRVTLG
jgi:hypothetical protein